MYLSTIPQAFYDQFPAVTPEAALQYYQKYLDVIADQLIKYGAYNVGGVISFSTHDALHRCGYFKRDGIKHYIWPIFHKLCPVITIINKGTNMTNKLSTARISDEYMELLIKTRDAKSILEQWFEGHDTGNVKLVPVDLVSMRHYLKTTEEDLEKNTGEQYRKKLRRNKLQMGQFLVIAEYDQECPALPHVGIESDYGREYYVGLNLQNCSREVRVACIGDHYQVDLNAAVYAIKLMLAEAIYQRAGLSFDGEFTCTKGYLDFRGAKRRQLAEHIEHYPDGERLVKEAIIAVGFGARLQNSSWVDDQGRQYSALTNIIKNPEDRHRFITDPWVVEFVKEQTELTDLIVGYYLEDAAMMQEVAPIESMFTPSGKIRRQQLMCYIFQKYERQIMRDMAAVAEPILLIHDAAIYQHKPKMLEINTMLGRWSKYLTADCDFIGGYRREIHQEEVRNHVALMEQEEQRIAQLHGKPVHKTSKKWIEFQQNYDGDGRYYDGSGWDGSNRNEAYSMATYDRDLDPWYEDDQNT